MCLCDVCPLGSVEGIMDTIDAYVPYADSVLGQGEEDGAGMVAILFAVL